MGKFTKFFTTTLWASSRRPFVRCEACRAQLAAQQQSTAPQPASPEQEQPTETLPSSLAQLAANHEAQQHNQPASTSHSSTPTKHSNRASQPASTARSTTKKEQLRNQTAHARKNSDTARPPAQLKVHPRKGDTN